MNPDPSLATEPAPFFSLALDAIVNLLRFPLKVLLFAMIIRLISKNEADLHMKAAVKWTAVVLVLTFLLNTSPSGVLSPSAFVTIVLITTLIVKKAFWVDIDKSLIASLLFIFLSISLTDYSNRGLDNLLPNRATVSGMLADQMDERTKSKLGDTGFPRSRRVMPALLRMTAEPDPEGGLVDDLMSPFRTLQKAKTQIANVDAIARDQASIVNMLSGAGTNVGDRAAEMQAFEQALVAEVQAGNLPVSSGTPPPAGGFGGAETYQGSATAETPAPAPAAAPAPEEEFVEYEEVEEEGPPSTFAESIAKSGIGMFNRLRGKEVPPDDPPPRRVRRKRAPTAVAGSPGATGAVAITQTAATAITGAVATVSGSVTGAVPVGAAASNATSVTKLAGVTNTAVVGGGITSKVAVTMGNRVVYVDTPSGLKISGVVSRKDGSGFLSCNGRIVSVGGHLTTSSDGQEVVLKLEAIENNQPRWSVVSLEDETVIPLGKR